MTNNTLSSQQFFCFAVTGQPVPDGTDDNQQQTQGLVLTASAVLQNYDMTYLVFFCTS